MGKVFQLALQTLSNTVLVGISPCLHWLILSSLFYRGEVGGWKTLCKSDPGLEPGSPVLQLTEVFPHVNRELPDVQAGFRKGRGTRDQIANICWSMEKTREFQKNIYFCFIDYAKTFDCVDHKKLWKSLKEMGIPDYLTCLLRNLYAGQEATVRTGHGTTDWFQIGKGVCQGCIPSPCLFNFYAEYIMRNAGLEEA